MTYLATTFGSNIPHAIRCTRYYRTKGRPFTAVEVGINRHTMKQLASKGILKLVAGEKARDPNRYVPTSSTIELLERRFADKL